MIKKILSSIVLVLCSFFCNKESHETTFLKGSITTHNITELTETTAMCGGKLIIDSHGNTADVRVPQKGVIWSQYKERISELSTFSEDKLSGMNNTPYQDNDEGFLCKIMDLEPNTKYYVRAFAQIGVTKKEYIYGDIKEFITTKTSALVETLPISNITATTVRLNGNITNAGIPIYSERGFCYSQSVENPTVDNEKISVENPIAVYTGQYISDLDITKLSKDTRYNIRAYIMNANEVSYGKPIILIAELPSIVLIDASSISSKSVFLEANLTNKGVPLSSEWGFCYSESSSFSANNTVKIDIKDIDDNGYYFSTLNDIKPNTTYYYYAYANSALETIHSEKKSFKTLVSSPLITTLPVSNLTPTSATISGQVIEMGVPGYTERGICYSRNGTPTVDNNEYKKIIQGEDTNVFSATFTNLIDGATYIARTYVVWNGQPIYGEIVKFVPYSYKEIGSLAVQKEDLGMELWGSANSLCKSSILGGKKWRLPTISELQILYNYKDDIGGFETERAGFTFYWTSTLQSTSRHTHIDFSDGSVNKFGSKFNDNTMYGKVRCVCDLSE